MQNKFKFGFMLIIASLVMPMSLRADEEVLIEQVSDVVTENTEDAAEQNSADAVAAYDVNGSLFQQITDLEQQKVLMQLEKERAQLDLELDRLAAEKIKLHMEIDTLSGRAEQQQVELENAMAVLEAETAKLEREKEALENAESAPQPAKRAATARAAAPVDDENVIVFSDNYRLVNVVGAGSQLQATIEDLSSGQNKRLSVGKQLDGYTVKSISLDDGVVFVGPSGDIQNLNITGNQN